MLDTRCRMLLESFGLSCGKQPGEPYSPYRSFAMSIWTTRRSFIKTAATAAAFGLGDLAFLDRLPRLTAQEANLDPKVVRFHPEIEPMVRLLEETPREKLLEEVAT